MRFCHDGQSTYLKRVHAKDASVFENRVLRFGGLSFSDPSNPGFRHLLLSSLAARTILGWLRMPDFLYKRNYSMMNHHKKIPCTRDFGTNGLLERQPLSLQSEHWYSHGMKADANLPIHL